MFKEVRENKQHLFCRYLTNDALIKIQGLRAAETTHRPHSLILIKRNSTCNKGRQASRIIRKSRYVLPGWSSLQTRVVAVGAEGGRRITKTVFLQGFSGGNQTLKEGRRWWKEREREGNREKDRQSTRRQRARGKKGEQKNESETRGTGVRKRGWSGIDKGSVGMRIGQKERAGVVILATPKDDLKRVNAAKKSTA